MSTDLISVSDRQLLNYKGVTTTVVGAMTAAEAIERAELDWTTKLVDAGYRVRGGVFSASKIGRKAIVRVDKNDDIVTDFGYVGQRFVPIQNTEIFDWCDKLVDDSGANYESAFSMYGGQQVGLTMRFPDTVQVGGEDPHVKYLLVSTRHDGTGSMTAAVTMVRMYCTNMLNVALRKADDRIRIPHLANASKKIAAARDSLQLTFKYVDEFEKEMESLIQRTIDEDTADAIIKEVLGKNRYGGLEAKSSAIRTLARESTTIQDEFRGTRYGLLQAATEWMDWGRVAKTPHGAAVSALDGVVRKTKGQLLEALAN